MKSNLILKGFASLFLTGSVLAGTSADITVGINVPPYCEILSSNPVNLNLIYNPYQFTNFTFAYFHFRCVKGTQFTMSAQSENNGYLVKVDDPSSKVQYSLIATVSYPTSSNTQGSDILRSPLTMVSSTKEEPFTLLQVFAPGGQNPNAGEYQDKVTIQVSY